MIGLLATTIGACSGVGGGVIIKPLLDALGIIPVLERNFLSSATVLSMAIVSLLRQSKNPTCKLQSHTALPLAVGSILGGILGNYLIRSIKAVIVNDTLVTTVQSAALLVVLISILLATFRQNQPVETRKSNSVSLLLGIALGSISVMLGIGGGPLNVALLTVIYGMPAKECVVNSLLIIFFSQASGLITCLLSGGISTEYYGFLFTMISGGILGGIIGSKLMKKLADRQIQRIFALSLIGICLVTTSNIIRSLL